MTFNPVRLGFFLLVVAVPAGAQTRPAPTRIDIAEGVYLFQSAPYGDVGLDGNSVVIVSDDGVLVFDSNGSPAAARAVLAEIRRITSQPVRYLVNSHWHWDHWYGAEVYKDSFPDVRIITHQRTRSLMAGPAIAFNQPGLDQQLPAHSQQVEGQLAGAADRASVEAHVARDRFFLNEKRSVRHTLATITFTDSLTIHLGRRVVRVLHHDRAITPGDTYLYLPDERIVVMGDLLINPITFALFCYPGGWIRTLEAIDALDARILIPGHGTPLQDESLLKATLALLRREHTMARESKAKGMSVEETRAAILADSDVLGLRTAITGGVAQRNDAFALYLVDWFVRRVFQELDGTLNDSIPLVP
jgi:glyoxylase-like metal-dependent hydrolase (beta-lactamase superfamily II)